MKLFGTIVAALLVAIILVPKDALNAQDAAKKDGKTIFTEAKCANCHAIQSQGIEAKNKKPEYPDLSDVGSKLKADFMKKYMKKEEAINGKKHLIAFKGEEADLDILCAWMETLKVEKK